MNVLIIWHLMELCIGIYLKKNIIVFQLIKGGCFCDAVESLNSGPPEQGPTPE